MATDRRDVEFAISAKTQGAADIVKLADTVEELARQGGEAAPKFAALGAELRTLASQNSKIGSLENAIVSAKEAYTELGRTRTQVDSLHKALADARSAGATAQAIGVLETELKSANREMASAEKAFDRSKTSLNGMRAAASAAGINVKDLAGEQVRLSASLKDAETRARFAGTAIGKASTEGAAGFAATAGSADRLADAIGNVRNLTIAGFGVSQISQYAQELGQVADQYKNIQARLKLATDGEAELAAAQRGTFEIAQRTSTALQTTSDLYARIAVAGRDLGKTQADALAITESINRAAQLSGASAQASDAAITQLLQGLQSGVLRGEEFNSIMEQTPRLAQALADGLGVTRGELRGMAQDGKLSSEVVIEALQSQAEVIRSEFAELPDTIGRATERLNNEWLKFVGNLDQSTGASAAVAEGLGNIADNLDTIAGYAARAGEVVLAALAVKAVGALRAFVVSASGGSVAAGTMAVAVNALAAAGERAALALRGGIWTALALVVYELGSAFFGAKSAAEEAGEAIDTALEPPAVNGPAEAMRLVATEAEAARFRLDDTQRSFAKLTADGKSASQALAEIFKAADTGSSAGIEALAAQIDSLKSSSLATGEQIQSALIDRLAKLSSGDLKDFGLIAEQSFNLGKIAAEQFAAVLDAQAGASLKRIGVDVDVAFTGLSEKFQTAADSVGIIAAQFDRLQQSGRDAGAILATSVDAALKAASNPAEFTQLADTVKRLGTEGRLAERQVVAALEAIRRKADDAVPGINSVAEAFRALGVTSDAELKKAAEQSRQAFDLIRSSGQATSADLKRAWIAYADDAIKANNGILSAATAAEGRLYGVGVAADAAGKAMRDAGASGAEALGDAAAVTRDLGSSAQAAAVDYGALADEIERSAAATTSQNARSSRTESVNARAEGYRQGLYGEQLDRFVAVYEDYQLRAQAEAINNLRRAPHSGDVDGGIGALSRASAAALQGALEYAHAAGGTRMGRTSATPSTGTESSTTNKQIIDLRINGRSYGDVAVADQSSANTLIDALRALQQRTSA